MRPFAAGDDGHLTRDPFMSREIVRAVHHAHPIETTEDVKLYLRKYGYLDCTHQESNRSKRQADGFGFALTEGRGDVSPQLSNCTAQDIAKALATFQRSRNLSPTGVVNPETVNAMREARCGDSDAEIAKREQNILSKEGFTFTGKLNFGYHDQQWLSHGLNDNAINHGRRKRNAASEPDYFNGFHDVPEGNLREHSSLLTKILLPHNEKSSVRQKMLTDMKKMIKEYPVKTRIEEVEAEVLASKPIIDVLNPRKNKLNRVKRDFDENFSENEVTKFSKAKLQYRMLDGGFSTRIPLEDQCSVVSLAFRMWSEVTNIDFEPADEDLPVQDCDILLAFGQGYHLDCNKPFDGQGGEIAHTNKSEGQGHIHFDGDEYYKFRVESPGQVPFLLAVVHELGHVLGLSHMETEQSVMYPTLVKAFISDDFELAMPDREAIQSLYGQCFGRLDSSFDWLHTDPSEPRGLLCMQPCLCETQKWQFYTFFFRDTHYWLYLNGEGRPRYGDPLTIQHNWHHLPETIDGVVQELREITCNLRKQKKQFEFRTVFFKGDHYYQYDDANDVVHESGLISEKYGPIPGYNESVPDNLDGALFDPRDHYLYFFKGPWVWVVDPNAPPESQGCCVSKHLFADLYLMENITETMDNFTDSSNNTNSTWAQEDDDSTALVGDIDSVYLQWSTKTAFFYRGNEAFILDMSDPDQPKRWGTPQRNWLQYMGAWNHKWPYLCDVLEDVSYAAYCSLRHLKSKR